jgi:hypothetical protein
MLRAPWSRTLAAVFAVWLALVMGDAGFAHPHCAMHDGAVPATRAAAMHDPSVAHDASAHDMLAQGAHAHGAPDAPPAGHGDHVCSCIGACAASGSAAAIGRAIELPQARVAGFDAAAPRGDAVTRLPRRVPFALPYANGPPPAIA